MSEDIRPIRVDKPANPNLEIYDFLVIDRSGSMGSVADVTITGINDYLANLQKNADEVKTFVSIILFDDEIIKLYDFVPAKEVRPLDRTTFVPRGTTALNDAVGTAIESLKERLKGREASDDVDVTISVFTDGYENASTKYSSEALKGYIKEIENAYKWTVTYTGAGNAAEVQNIASTLGFNASNVQAYSSGTKGTSQAFGNLSRSRLHKTRSLVDDGVKCSANYFAPSIDQIDPADAAAIYIPAITTTTPIPPPDYFTTAGGFVSEPGDSGCCSNSGDSGCCGGDGD